MHKAEQLALAQRAACGDGEAIESLYVQTAPLLRSYLIRKFKSSEELLGYVDDAIQNVWVDALVRNRFSIFRGDSLFHKFLAPNAVWSVLGLNRGYGRKHERVLSLEERYAAGIEPSYVDTSFEEREAYNRFYGVWCGLPREDQELLQSARESGRKSTHLTKLHSKLRGALTQAA